MPVFYKYSLLSMLCMLLWTNASYAEDAVKAPVQSKIAENSENSVKNVSSTTYIDIIPSDTMEEDPYPIDTNTPTHPAINLSPDKSELVRLDEPVSKVITGNPNHLTVLPSTSKELILVGRMPGASHFTALNAKGEIIMQRHVIVAGPKNKYIRIRKSCAASEDEDCQNTQVYYCPDTCHEISLNTEEGDGDNTEGENSDNTSGENSGGAPEESE